MKIRKATKKDMRGIGEIIEDSSLHSKDLTRKIFSSFLFIIGIALILNSLSGITGFVIASSIEGGLSSILGLILIIGGVVLFVSGRSRHRKYLGDIVAPTRARKKVVLTIGNYRDNKGNNDKALLKLAREAAKSQDIKDDINSLMEKYFVKGIERPGTTHTKGGDSLFGDIKYLKGRNGGRVYFREKPDYYEVLAYAKGTGQGKGKNKNERRVINKLKELYR